MLDVHTNGCAGTGGSRKTEDDTRTISHEEADTLLLGDGAIDGVDIGKVIGGRDGVLAHNSAGIRCGIGAHLVHHGSSALLVHALEVPSAVVVASVLGPVLSDDVLDSNERLGRVGVDRCKDLQPGKDGPNAILFTDMIGTSSKTLLATDEGGVILSTIQGLGIHEVTKVLPTGGSFEEIKVQILGDKVNGTRGGHRASNALETTLSLEVGDGVGVRSDDGKGIRGGDKELSAEDHVAITIAIGGSSKGWDRSFNVNLVALLVKAHDGNELLGVCEVGIGVAAVEIILGSGIHAGALRLAKLVNEDGLRVGSVDSIHGVVDHGKIGTIEKSLDGRKVEDALQKVDVNLGGIDNLDGNLLGAISPSDGGAADGGDVDGGEVRAHLVSLDSGGIIVNLISELLGSWAAVLAVVFDTKVLLRSTGVVRGGEDESTEGLPSNVHFAAIQEATFR